jgi:WD40 repeat protein
MRSQVGRLPSSGPGPPTRRDERAAGLSDLFISYASEDEKFVDRLHGALGRCGREVWVYTEGILPADEWKIAAHEAIARSDALLFVMSTASLASEPCLGELTHAFMLDKRVIPVCIDDAVKNQRMPHRLAAKAWIMMSTPNEFARMLHQVIEALDTDLELARVHTRILVRSEAWDRGGRHKSPLLRGDELRAAEQWLADAALDGGPQPTQLQREFLAASARESSVRRWRLGIISAVVLSVVVVLSVLALVLRAQSNTRAQIALSRQLANKASDSFANNHPDVGILLSLEAERSAHTVDALSSLIRSVEAIPAGMVGLRLVPTNTTGVMYGPDGRTVAFASGELWNTQTGRMRTILHLDGSLLATFSPNGRVIAGGLDRSTVKLWNVVSGALVRVLRTHGVYVTSIAFSPDGRTLAAATNSGAVLRWYARTGVPFGKPLHEPSQVNAVTYSNDGRLLAVGTDTGKVELINNETNEPEITFPVGTSVYRLDFSPDDRQLAVAIASGQVLLRDLNSGSVKALPAATIPPNARQTPEISVAFSPTERILATSSNTGNLMLWSSITGTLLRTEPYDSAVSDVAFSPNGSTIATVDAAGKGILWNTNAELAVGRAETSSAAPVDATAISSDGRLLAVGRMDGSIEVSDRETGRVLWQRTTPPGQIGVTTLAFSPNRQLLVSAGDDAAIEVWNAQTGRQLRVTRTDGLVSQVAFTHDGNRIAASVDDRTGTLLLLNAATGSLIRKLHAGASVVGVAWLAGGRVAADSARGTVVLAAGSGARTHVIPGNANTTSVASNPDGTMLALLNASGALTLWDATTWKRLYSLSAPSDGGHLAFTQDGRTLAVGSTNGRVQLWNVASGQQLGDVFRVPQTNPEIPDDPTGVNTLSFDPTATSLVMGTSAGTVVTLGPLPLSNGAAANRFLCDFVRRNLATSEWHQLLPTTPYHRTCALFGYN